MELPPMLSPHPLTSPYSNGAFDFSNPYGGMPSLLPQPVMPDIAQAFNQPSPMVPYFQSSGPFLHFQDPVNVNAEQNLHLHYNVQPQVNTESMLARTNQMVAENNGIVNLPDGLLTPPLTPVESVNETKFDFDIGEFIKPIIPEKYETTEKVTDINYELKLLEEKLLQYSNEKDVKRSLTNPPNPRYSRRNSTVHNSLERKRRGYMKWRFNELRKAIPILNKHERAPKILILNEAIKHVKELNGAQSQLLVDKELEKHRNVILLGKLNEMKKHFKE